MSQAIFLFDDTVASNIAFGVPHDEIDMARVKKAAATAHIDKFIEQELPEGYNTKIGDRGTRLSGGQRQRIGIARAFYRSSEIIIFDEATNALDGRTEALVQDAIYSFQSSCTIILITHRLSSVSNCDRIFVLDSGRIVGEGTLDELRQSNVTLQKIDINKEAV